MRAIRTFLIVLIALFAFAALTHSGIVMSGHRHRPAATAETVIGVVLLMGLLAGLIRPAAIRAIAITVQAFALLGTGVGIFTIIVGIGPRSTLDVVFHSCMAIALIAGLVVALKASPPATGDRKEREPYA
jgi:hypothetical protein